MQRKVKAIVFDLGNVLLNFDLRKMVKKLQEYSAGNKKEVELYLLQYNENVILFERGKISPEEFFLKIKDMLQLNLTFEQFRAIWNDIFYLRREMLDILTKLSSERIPLYILSNTNALHFEFVREKFFKLFSFFDSCILSCEVGFRKPEEKMYKYLLSKLMVRPQEVFFVDDIAANVEAAFRLGIQSHLFRDENSLRGELSSLLRK